MLFSLLIGIILMSNEKKKNNNSKVVKRNIEKWRTNAGSRPKLTSKLERFYSSLLRRAAIMNRGQRMRWGARSVGAINLNRSPSASYTNPLNANAINKHTLIVCLRNPAFSCLLYYALIHMRVYVVFYCRITLRFSRCGRERESEGIKLFGSAFSNSLRMMMIGNRIE